MAVRIGSLQSRRATAREFRPPRPLRTLLLMLGPAAAPAALAAAGVTPWHAAGECAGVLMLVALLRGGQVWIGLIRCRAAADRLILEYPRIPQVSPLIVWRTQELTSERERRILTSSLRRMIREATASRRLNPPILNISALRANLPLLKSLHLRLADQSRPISARGVVVLNRLLTDATSPLYERAPGDKLPDVLQTALDALEIAA